MKQILWAHADFTADLSEELKRKKVSILGNQGNLFLVESDRHDFIWTEAIGLDAETLSFQSISEAQSLLRGRGQLWASAPAASFRRSELIAEGLFQPKKRKRKFLEKIPKGKLGSYCLVSDHEMWISPMLEPAVAPGAWDFEESLEAPSRAYLKLWELFTREGFHPQPGEKVLELGSAPGGWTWVLAKLGCHVTAVDKGQMDPKILSLPNVKWVQKDAFVEDIAKLGPMDWFFSDLICYPQRLLELVKRWADQRLARQFVCTIKFQGPTDFAALDDFLRLQGSKAIHLHQNKHEITWVWRPKP